MARARNIKPGFFENDLLAERSPLTRLLFAGLWTIADREGRLEDRPNKVKAKILPYDECNCEAMLQELHDHGFILRYESEGARYIQILQFGKHQNPHKDEKASAIPAPKLHGATSMQQRNEHSSNRADSPIPDSPIPDSQINPAAAPRDEYPPEFEEAYRAFPSRPGSSKKKAFAAWTARRKAGVSAEEIKAGVLRYAAYVQALGTEPQFIQMPATFFGPSEHFRSDWTPSQPRASPSRKPSVFSVAGKDHSSTRAAAEASRRKHGISAASDDEISL